MENANEAAPDEPSGAANEEAVELGEAAHSTEEDEMEHDRTEAAETVAIDAETAAIDTEEEAHEAAETEAIDAEVEENEEESGEESGEDADTPDERTTGAADDELSAGPLTEPDRAHQPPSSSPAADEVRSSRRGGPIRGAVSYREARPYGRRRRP